MRTPRTGRRRTCRVSPHRGAATRAPGIEGQRRAEQIDHVRHAGRACVTDPRDLLSTPTSGTYTGVRYQQVVLPPFSSCPHQRSVAHRSSTSGSTSTVDAEPGKAVGRWSTRHPQSSPQSSTKLSTAHPLQNRSSGPVGRRPIRGFVEVALITTGRRCAREVPFLSLPGLQSHRFS